MNSLSDPFVDRRPINSLSDLFVDRSAFPMNSLSDLFVDQILWYPRWARPGPRPFVVLVGPGPGPGPFAILVFFPQKTRLLHLSSIIRPLHYIISCSLALWTAIRCSLVLWTAIRRCDIVSDFSWNHLGTWAYQHYRWSQSVWIGEGSSGSNVWIIWEVLGG